jgi:hypothetical protein
MVLFLGVMILLHQARYQHLFLANEPKAGKHIGSVWRKNETLIH